MALFSDAGGIWKYHDARRRLRSRQDGGRHAGNLSSGDVALDREPGAHLADPRHDRGVRAGGRRALLDRSRKDVDRRASAAGFAAGKRTARIGLGVVACLYFIAFLVIANEYF